MCRNPVKCGRCWEDGHQGNKCTKEGPVRGQPKKPTNATNMTPPPSHVEPSFEDLLSGPYPSSPPLLPNERPEEILCFVERDATYEKEMIKLERGVILNSATQEITPNEATSLVVKSNLVSADEISIAGLSTHACLIILPAGLSPDTFIKSTPTQQWEMGFSYQQWSPYLAASICIPTFKVLMELDIPINLWREQEVARAVSSFGLYLGSVEQRNPAIFSGWTVAIATDDLNRIPRRISFMVGGFKHKAEVRPIKVVQAPLYREEDLPRRPPTYSRQKEMVPMMPDPSGGATEELRIPRRLMLELCKDRDILSIPAEVRQLLGFQLESGDGGERPQTPSLPPQMAIEDPSPNPPTNPDPNLVSILQRPSVAGPIASPVMSTTPRKVNDRPHPIPNPKQIPANPVCPLILSPDAGMSGRKLPNLPRDSPKLSTPKTDGRVAQEDKGKGLAQPDSQLGLLGAFSPSSNSTLKEFQESARQKRKSKARKEAGPSKKTPKAAGADLVDVLISYDHSLLLAKGFGLPIKEVQEAAQDLSQEYHLACSQVKDSQPDLEMVHLGSNTDSDEGCSDTE